MSRTTYDNKALTKLISQLKKLEKLTVQVGIFGDRATRRGDDGTDNVTLGTKHEFGVVHESLPARSWLRMPLGPRFKQRMDKTGSAQYVETLMEDGPTATAELVAAEAEGQIQDAFDSNGFGTWALWSRGYASATGRILDDTSQMRNAVSSRIVGGGAP